MSVQTLGPATGPALPDRWRPSLPGTAVFLEPALLGVGGVLLAGQCREGNR